MRRVLVPALAVALLAAGCSADPGRAPASPAAADPAAASAASASAAPVTAPAGSATLPARGPQVELTPHGAGTTVRLIDRSTRIPRATAELAGRWQLPVVVPGTPPEGATAGGAVVLTGPADGGRSRFAVLAPPYTAPALVDLPAGFGYDAVSPDGGRLYLVQHLPPAGSEHYQVRRYDVAARRLDPAVVVDKTHLDEWMAGRPVSRMTSADGATVATLYQRRGEAPFIHVLNTVEGFALCLDLPASAGGLPLAVTSLEPTTLVVADQAGVPRFRADLAAGGELQDLTAQCRDGITRAPLPTWARTGFSDDGSGLPHVLGDQGRIIAALFEYPLHPAADPGVTNKVLWIPAPSPAGSAAPADGPTGLTVEGELLGTPVRITRQLPDGPGPSGVNFPRAGCWSLTLRWSGLTDTLMLPVG